MERHYSIWGRGEINSYRFESCPDYGEMIISLYGIRSIKPENLSDRLERQANGQVAKMVIRSLQGAASQRNVKLAYRFESCPDYEGVLVAPDGFRCATFPPTTNNTMGLIQKQLFARLSD